MTRRARVGLVWIGHAIACGYLDGDPIVGGAPTESGSGSSATTGTTGADSGSASTGSASSTASADATTTGPDPCACTEGARCVRIFNACDATIEVQATADVTPTDALDGPWTLESGACEAIGVDTLGGGRVWASTGCEAGACTTGPGITPVTLVQLTLGELDFYNLSLVEGFNLPLSIAPLTNPGPGEYQCRVSECGADLVQLCPDDLVQLDDAAQRIACRSACTAFGDDPYCCTGDYDSPDTCGPTSYSMFFEAACPDAYSYPFDDATSTFTCATQPDYDIVFCP